MKVRKNGTVKLESGEVRIGNFFVKDEGTHIRLQDLNSVFSHRVDKRMPVGIWLANMLEQKSEPGHIESIRTYIAATWSLFSVVPDNDFITEVIRVADECMNRHPDWYGIKADATPEEDAEAIREVREMKQFEEDVKKVAENY